MIGVRKLRSCRHEAFRCKFIAQGCTSHGAAHVIPPKMCYALRLWFSNCIGSSNVLFTTDVLDYKCDSYSLNKPRVVFVGGGEPGIFPVTGFYLPSCCFEMYHPNQGSLIPRCWSTLEWPTVDITAYQASSWVNLLTNTNFYCAFIANKDD